MKQFVSSKLLRKVLTLAFLIAALVFIVSGDKIPQPVYAAPCCEECDGAELDACMAECTTSACRRNCINNSCEANCVSCGGGGGGGCLTNADCPYLPGYGFANCVGGNCVY
jgi:hypothetical protein